MKKLHEPESNVPKQVISLDLAHRLLELADQYHVHVAPQFRAELLKLQDRVIAAMNLVAAKGIRAE